MMGPMFLDTWYERVIFWTGLIVWSPVVLSLFLAVFAKEAIISARFAIRLLNAGAKIAPGNRTANFLRFVWGDMWDPSSHITTAAGITVYRTLDGSTGDREGEI